MDVKWSNGAQREKVEARSAQTSTFDWSATVSWPHISGAGVDQ